jgi:hypothetical protein
MDGFTITREDAKILEKYVEEFEEADGDLQSELIRTIMAELRKLQSVDTPFDKLDANKVSSAIHYTRCISC